MIECGEWQFDEMGRKYRKIGNCIEYAPTITTTCGNVLIDDLPKIQKKVNESAEKQRKETLSQLKQAPNRSCPFKKGKNSIHTNCESSCAFYENNSCIFASSINPDHETKGNYCPISGTCYESCSMYNHGCTLTHIIKGMKPGKV